MRKLLVAMLLCGVTPVMAQQPPPPQPQLEAQAFVPIHIDTLAEYNRWIIRVRSTRMLYDEASGMLTLLEQLKTDAEDKEHARDLANPKPVAPEPPPVDPPAPKMGD